MADLTIDTETVVNSYTTSDQQFPTVTALIDGGWVVTWQSNFQDGDGFGIYQQRYRADGTAVDGEVLVNTTTVKNQQIPVVAGLEGGGWVTSWMSSDSNNQWHVFQQLYKADGTRSGGEVELSTAHTINGEWTPALMALDGGGWLAIWRGADPVTSQTFIYQQRYDSSGGTVGSAEHVNSTPLVLANTMQSVTMLPEGGYVVTWMNQANVLIDSVSMRLFDPDGEPIGSETLIASVADPLGAITRPATTVLADGGWVVSWSGVITGLSMVRFDSDGSVSGSVINVPSSGSSSAPQVVATPDGGWAAIWSNVNDISMQLYDADGNAAGGQTVINTFTDGLQWQPSAAVLENGNIVITWGSNGGDGNGYGISQTVVSFGETSNLPVNEDAPHTFDASDFDFSIGAGTSLVSIEITELPAAGTLRYDGNPFTVPATFALADLEKLVWTPPADANGNGLATLKFTATDSNDDVKLGKIMFDVASVQDAPTAADHTVTLGENNAHTFRVSDFGFSDTADGDTLASIMITALPENGTLTLYGQNVVLDVPIDISDIAHLVWTPAADVYGDDLASLSFTVTDSGSTTSASSNTITFDVTKTLEPHVGSETIVNNSTTSDQKNPAMTKLADGGWVVTWQSPDGSDFGIYQQRYDADGIAVEGEILVNSTTTDTQQLPSVTGLEGGGWVVTWQSAESSSQHIYQQQYNADGTKNGDQVAVSAQANVGAASPSVTALEDGGWVTTWGAYDSSVSTNFVYQQRYDSDGGTVGNIEAVSTTHLTSTNSFSTGIALPDGGWLVSWIGGDDGSSTSLSFGTFAQRFDQNGDAVGSEIVLATGQQSFSLPGITMLTDGGWVIGWNNGTSISMQHFDASGDQIGSVISNGFGSDNADVVATSDGGWALVWSTFSGAGGFDVEMQLYDADGNAAGNPVLVNTYTDNSQQHPSAIALDDGRVVITWASTGADGDSLGISQTIVNFAEMSRLPIDEDAPHTFDLSEFDFSVEGGASLVSITISALPANGTLTYDGQAVSVRETIPAEDLGRLVWTPDADANGGGLASFKFTSLDDAGHTKDAQLTFDVAAVQDAPTAQDNFLTVGENKSYTFTAADFGFSDTADNDTLASITITAPPENGTLKLNGLDVTLDLPITAADIPNLVWTPDRDTYGRDTASLTFRVTDSGGLTSVATNTITLDVAAMPEYEANGNVLVNSYTTAAQQSVSVTALDNGGWVVTWESVNQDGDHGGIYQQRYDADGATVGDEIHVNTTTAGSQDRPRVAALHDGGWVVTWQSSDQDGSASGVYQQRYAADGTTAGDETHVSTATSGDQSNSAVTALEAGGWVVTWQSFGQDGYANGVYQQRYAADGTTAGNETHVSTATTGDQNSPSVTALQDGGWVVTWTDSGQDGDSYGVYQQRYDADGTADIAGEVLVNTTTASDQQASAVTALADGGWLVTWMSGDQDGDGYGIYQQRYGADGAAIGEEIPVNTATANDQQMPMVMALDNGGWAVAWMGFSGTWDIYTQVYDADGDPVGTEIIVNSTASGSQMYPSIAALPDGKFVVSWVDTGLDGSGDIVQTVVSPVVADKVALDEDTTHSFAQSEFDFSAKNGTLDFITVTAVPGSGALTLDGDEVTVGQVITADALDGLAWTPDADDNGTGLASFKFKAQDSNGDKQLAKLTFNVAAIDDAPTAADNALTVGENKSYTFSAADFGFSDVDGDTLASIRITALPENGTLTLDGEDVTLDSVIAAADIAKLVWTPSADTHGRDLASLSFTVTDSDSTSSTSSNTITFDVKGIPEYVADGDVVVNTHTADSQYLPAITTLEDGGWVVTWASDNQDSGTGGVYQQRYAADGTASGSETLVNTYSTNSQYPNSITALSDGGWVVTWYSIGQDGSSYGVFQQRYDANGGKAGLEIPVNSFTTGEQIYPAVSALEDGGWLVTWQSKVQDGDGYGIYQQRYDAAGIADGVEAIVNTHTDSDQSKVAVTGLADGGWVVTWQSKFQDQSSSGVYQQRYDADGNKDGLETLVNTFTQGDQSVPTITALDDGGWLVAWASFMQDGASYGIYQQRYAADGNPVGGETQVNTYTSSAQNLPSVTSLPNGGWVVAWVTINQADDDGNIVAQVYDSEGDKVGGEIAINGYLSTEQGNPRITALADGSFVVAWESMGGQDGEGGGVVQTVVRPVYPTDLTLQEDASHTFSAADFEQMLGHGESAVSVTVKSLPEEGTLMLGNHAVIKGETIQAADFGNLVWTPGANANGDDLAKIVFKVTDNNSQATNVVVHLDVTSVNDTPTAADNTLDVLEDKSLSFDASDFGFSDVDLGDAMASITITDLPDNGTLKLDGVTVVVNQTILAGDIEDLKWTPAANQHGDGLASLSFKVTDSNNATSATANTLTFDVSSVSDAPTTTDKTITVVEDGSHSFSAADFAFADVDNDGFLSVVIKSVPTEGMLTLNGEAVVADQEIAADDLVDLKWAPDANDNGDGLASFTFAVKDDSARPSFARRPADDMSEVHTITFNVTPVGDAPTAQDGPVFLAEDESYSFTAADFGFADADLGDTLASITITAVPANGSLKLDGVTVAANQEILAGDIDGLTWTPAANQHGDDLASLSFKVTDSSGTISQSANTITFDVNSVSDAPTATDKTITVVEDGSHSFSETDFGFADNDNDGFLSVVIKSVPAEGALTLNGEEVSADQEIAVADLVNLKWAPDANDNGNGLASFTFAVKDDSAQVSPTGRAAVNDTSEVHTITFNVTPVNDAPTAQNDTLTVDEDGSHSFTLADFDFADIDSGDSLASVTITTLPDKGSLTLNGRAVTTGQVVDAADLASLKWTPAADSNGDPLTSMAFKVTDSHGATSASAYTLTLDVTAVADAPTGADNTISLNEDGSHSFTAADFGFADSDGNSLASVTIDALPASGQLMLNGVAVTANQEIPAGDIAGLTWTPAADYHGNDMSLAFTVKDSSGSASTEANHIVFDVAAVADAPTGAASTISVVEDGSHAFSAADFGFADVDGDSLASITITALPGKGSLTLNGVRVDVDQVITAGDIADLVWTPAANAHSDDYASLSFKVTDGTGLTSASAYTLGFDVTTVADAPTGTDDTIALNEDGSYSFTASDFGFADGDGDSLASVTIGALPASGQLMLNGVAVTANQEIPAGDIAGLAWTPAADYHGNDMSLAFTVKDSSGSVSAEASHLVFNVAAVADAPTAADTTIHVAENGSYTFTAADFGFADVDGDTLASVTIAALPGSGTLTLNGVAVAANDVIDAADLGGLVWTPAADDDETASFAFTLTDSSGSTSASAHTITFDVGASTDLPTGADNTISLQEDGSYSFQASDFGFADGDGDRLQSVTIAALPSSGTLTLNGVAVAANQEIPAGDIAGLTWTPAADYHGNDMSLAFTVKDSSGSVSAEANHLVFNVAAVADAPTATDTTIHVAENGSYTFTAADFGFADADGDTLASVTIAALPGSGMLTLNGVAVAANDIIDAADLGGLVWTPAADDDEAASFAFTLTDSSGSTSASAHTITFDVGASTDLPTGADNTISLQEDGSYSFQASDFGFADGDGDRLQSVTIAALPSSGTLTLNGVAVEANDVIDAADLGGLTWTPAADEHGEGLASLSFKVTDSSGSTSASAYTLSFDVTAMPDAPTAADTTIHVAENGSHTFTAADFGFADADGDTLASVTITALPGSGTLTLNGVAVDADQEIMAGDIGGLVWTPADGDSGEDLALAFTVKDSSGSASVVHTITLDVDDVTNLPTGADTTVTIDEDSRYAFTEADFGFADADSDTFDFLTIVDLPASGSLTLEGEEVTANQVIAAAALDGLVWTPDANDNGEGLAAFSFRVTDSSGETSADVNTVTFDVDAVNDGPSARNDDAKLTEGKSVTVNVLANDRDVDGDTLSASHVKVTSGNGKVTVNDAGKLVVSYTGADLDPGQKATITVKYDVSDGSQSDGGMLKVAVTGVAEAGDDINGTPRPDTLTGTNVGERITSFAQNDVIKALGGRDNISAGSGNDKIDGGTGNDKIGASAGDDIVRGGKGNDEIHGWGGEDSLTGGDGADTFVFHRRDGDDTITDFHVRGKAHDILDLRDIDETITFHDVKSMMHQDGKDVVIELPHGTDITVKQVDIDDLSKEHFLL